METENVTVERKKRRRRGGNGAGYIFRSGNFWYLRYRDWRMKDGQMQWVQVCDKVTKVDEGYRSKYPPADVVEIAKEKTSKVAATKETPESTRFLGDFIETVYLPTKREQRRASTATGYEARWKTLKPYCRDERGQELRLRDTTTMDIERILGRVANERGLTQASLHDLRKIFSGAFRLAIKKGLVSDSPVKWVTLPNAQPNGETHAYSLAELQWMLRQVPEPARTAVAVAGYAGLGRGEIRGLSWEDYGTCEFHDGQQLQKMLALQVRKSVWNGITSEPKTKARKAPVPVIGPLAQMLDAHRRRCGNPSTGPIFANHEGKAACMNNLRNRQVMPALRRCATCGKSRREHRKAGHAFLLDTSCPQWHGWHAFRRGLATNLHHMGVPDKVIQLILRHENVAVTQKCYIKTFTPDAAAAMRRFEEQLPATAAVQ